MRNRSITAEQGFGLTNSGVCVDSQASRIAGRISRSSAMISAGGLAAISSFTCERKRSAGHAAAPGLFGPADHL
jgi:hypothetical protein